MIKLITLIITIAICVAFAACSANNANTEPPSELPSASTSPTEVTEQAKEHTDEELIAGAKKIAQSLYDYKSGDNYEAFAALYTSDTTEEIIKQQWEADFSNIGNYQAVNAIVVEHNKDYYWVNLIPYNVTSETGKFVDADYSYGNIHIIMKEEDGTLKMYPSGAEKINFENLNIFKADYYKANKSFYSTTNGNFFFMPLDENLTLVGCNTATVWYGWTDEEGNAHLMFYYANGDANPRTLTNLEITLTDADGNQILEYYDANPGMTVAAQHSKVEEIIVPASEVNQSLSWDSLSTHCSFDTDIAN